MRFITIFVFTLLFNSAVFAELIKPSPNINPKEVISIQLDALMINDLPYQDAGINQTWEFAHPQNRKFTGPLSNFTKMMKSKSYILMLNHIKHDIIFVSKIENTANYFVELQDKLGNNYGFTWIVKKVLTNGIYKDYWMTTGVSNPLPLAKSA
jgi:hypothetical protein